MTRLIRGTSRRALELEGEELVGKKAVNIRGNFEASLVAFSGALSFRIREKMESGRMKLALRAWELLSAHVSSVRVCKCQASREGANFMAAI